MTDRILRKRDVCEITGMCDNTLRTMEAAGNFPRRFTLNPGGVLVGWKASAVSNWIEERAAAVEAA